ncbi:P22 phage major capsid protein family protein [Sphingomonas sp. 10B4]|uniref:P22 phage major capsid protein family protein n=1 Tax=Sphingomonas sp. 10B4 TaxID=3048575 RepID=UPI002AB58C64|nr:P22 phage major capsid protein family protein [Sphingomonas sp. 10B4]MDY7525495.1 P22 phage major capsid protein family protein [Sphingomonas sp. 10B4]MEB0281439.1 P22 phage major capsid protein family protein [Sphingomonas sp. 10B4]
MANTLTSLIPTLYESLDTVSREMVGFIPAVSRNTSAERAALNETILVPITGAQTAADNTPGVTAPNTGDQTIGNVSMTISKSKHVPIRWNGEEQKGLTNAGTYGGILGNQFTQAFRTLTNMVEADLFNAALQNASRAYGTAGTTPFGTAGDLSDIAQVRKLLSDNGSPLTDLQYVGGTSTFANLRGKQNVLFKVNEAGTDALLRNGIIGRLEGFDLHESVAVTAQTKGTGASYTTTTAGFPVGTTQIPLITGTGTVNPGDYVSVAGDANKYMVTGGISAPGTVTIGAPGLLQAIPASATAVTVSGSSSLTPNMAFSKSAIQLITRSPQMPMGPDGVAMDMADDVIQVTDPVSGIVFDVAVYRQFMQLVYHVRLAWGAAGIKPNHTVVSLG